MNKEDIETDQLIYVRHVINDERDKFQTNRFAWWHLAFFVKFEGSLVCVKSAKECSNYWVFAEYSLTNPLV